MGKLRSGLTLSAVLKNALLGSRSLGRNDGVVGRGSTPGSALACCTSFLSTSTAGRASGPGSWSQADSDWFSRPGEPSSRGSSASGGEGPGGALKGAREGAGASSRAEAVVLSQRISRARDLEELSLLIDSYGKRFNFYNVTSAINRLPKVLPHSQPTSAREEMLTGQLLDMALKCAADLDAMGASSVLWGLAKLGCPREDLLQALEEFLPEHIGDLNAKQVAKVVWAYGSMERQPPPRVMAELMAAVEGCASHSSPQGVANMIWGLARLDLQREATALQRLEKRAMALLQQRGPGGARGAHGAPGPRQVPPWASHAPMSRPAQGFKPQELAMTLWGLAALRRSPSAALLKLVMKEVTLQGEALSPQELAPLAWGTARLEQLGVAEMPSNLDEGIKAIESAALKRIRQFKPQEMSNLIWALGVLTSHGRLMGDPKPQSTGGGRSRGPRAPAPPPTGQRFIAAACSRLALGIHDHSPQGLANIVWGLAACRNVPDPALIHELMAEVHSRGPSVFTDQALSNMLWGCAELNVVPDRPVLEAIVEELLRRRPLAAQVTGNSLWALAVFDAVDSKVFSALAEPLEEQLGAISDINLRQVWQAAMARTDRPATPGSESSALVNNSKLDQVLAAAGEAWRMKIGSSLSPAQKEVCMTLRVMGIPHEVEAVIPGDPEHRAVDVLIPPQSPGSATVALEVDGEQHFAVNNPRHELGGTALRNRQLAKAGAKLARIHFLEWGKATTMPERQQYLERVLREAGWAPVRS